MRNLPAYAPAGDPLYQVRPLLHEPDPKNISWWQSATGWAIRKGERLKVTAAYDGTRPHTRVMGIEHIYVAPPADAGRARLRARRRPTRRRSAPSSPTRAMTRPRSAHARPPRPDGSPAPRPGRRARGARVKGDVASVFVRDFTFGPRAADGPPRRDRPLALRRRRQARRHARRRPARLRLTVARSAATRYAHRFTKPGTYLLHCSLHAAYMSQVVKVTRARPRRRDADRPRR